VSEVFDLPRLSSALGLPLVEWPDAKDLAGPDIEVEQLGCWSVREAIFAPGEFVPYDPTPARMGLGAHCSSPHAPACSRAPGKT
jgi:hypothetical protein